MNGKYFQFGIWLLWLALPLTWSRFRQVWDQLPARMATHFDFNWQPNGWMTRETAFWFALGLTAFLLVVFTVISYLIARAPGPELIRWAMLGFSYAVVGFVYAINSWVVQYNLTHKP